MITKVMKIKIKRRNVKKHTYKQDNSNDERFVYIFSVSP